MLTKRSHFFLCTRHCSRSEIFHKKSSSDCRSLIICIMFAWVICTFVICISCIQAAPPAPPSLLSALLSPSAAVSAPPQNKDESTGLTTYDQKQSGKFNIHISLKDIAIIALDAGNVDSSVGDFSDDYYEDYDLSDFTIKPIAGLIDITSDKPSTTTAAPVVIHSEEATSSNETENTPIIEEPIIKDPVKEPVNKTQSVVILSEKVTTPKPAVTILGSSENSSGIVVTTSTPSPEDLPPKISLTHLANVQSVQNLAAFPALFQTKPNEIPVQILLEPIASQKHSSRQRVRNRFRTTPSHNRRITPPHLDNEQHSAALGNRKHSLSHANRRNCVLDQNGQCQNSNRRFGSPTL